MAQHPADTHNWPAIVHKDLENSELSRSLCRHLQKVKYSSTTAPSSVILPLSKVAFLFLELQRIKDENTAQMTERLERFSSLHACAYIICVSPLFSKQDMVFVNQLQINVLHTKLQFTPAHNAPEAAKFMVNTAKVLCKPASDIMLRRLQLTAADITSSFSAFDFLLKKLDISVSDIHRLQDSLGSLACLASASEDDILDCGLSRSDARKILQFFGN